MRHLIMTTRQSNSDPLKTVSLKPRVVVCFKFFVYFDIFALNHSGREFTRILMSQENSFPRLALGVKPKVVRRGKLSIQSDKA